MTNEQLFEQLAPYLPYSLKWVLSNDKYIMNGLSYGGSVFMNNGQVFSYNKHEDFPRVLFPIFRPLSDLTKPCLDGGKVPIDELLKIYNENYGDLNVIEYDLSETFILYGLDSYDAYDAHEVAMPLEMYKQLQKWHFWLGDQNEFGKSIVDINTI